MNPSTREETFMRGISNVLQGNDSGVSITPSSRTEYFLNEILTAASGGGGGGGNLFIVKITENEFTAEPESDKNWSEISAAFSSGLPVIGVFISQNIGYVYNSVVCDNFGADFTALYSVVNGSSLEITHIKDHLNKGQYNNMTRTENTFTIS